MPEGFRLGLIVGALAVAVVGLVIAVIVLAGDLSPSTTTVTTTATTSSTTTRPATTSTTPQAALTTPTASQAETAAQQAASSEVDKFGIGIPAEDFNANCQVVSSDHLIWQCDVSSQQCSGPVTIQFQNLSDTVGHATRRRVGCLE